ncbi:MAG TPA: ABC transporter ATP-binding protein [Vicinamibacterales bacterium]
MSADAVVVDGLGKRFGDVAALAGVSFTVARGERFGVIGPDGAGKTSLFRVLATLLRPDAGTVRVLGLDPVRDLWTLRPRLGYMPGRFSLYPDLSVDENLHFFAAVFGTRMEDQRAQIDPVYRQLEPFRGRRAGALSGGMKQKLALCCALIHTPELLLLDEPTTGVDAVSRREFWDLLDELQAQGLTVIVSTPYMDEATRCDRVALLQQGGVMAVDTPRAIASSFGRPLFAVEAADRYKALLALRAAPSTRSVFPFGASLHYTHAREDLDVGGVSAEVTDVLRHAGVAGARVTSIEPTIEDIFIARADAG